MKNLLSRKCKWCGIDFPIYSCRLKRKGRGNYCSLKCKNLARRNKPIKCKICGKLVDRRYSERKFCSWKCFQVFVKKNITYKKQPKIQYSKQYNLISFGRGIFIPEHRYVWARENGKIPHGYIIHHLNGIKTDNRIENLCLLNRKEHLKIHSKEHYKLRIRGLEEKIKVLEEKLNESKTLQG